MAEFAEITTSIIDGTKEQATSHCLGPKLAPYNPTNVECITMALTMLGLGDHEYLFDLGCGDGRFMIEAIRRNNNVRAIGIEYDLNLCIRAQDNVSKSLNVEQAERCKVVHENVLNTDLSDATAIFIYLVPEGMKALRETLIELLKKEKGVRIVTYVFSIPGLVPQETQVYKGSTKLYLYTNDSCCSSTT